MVQKKTGSFGLPSMYTEKKVKKETTPRLTGPQSRKIQECLNLNRCEIPKCPYGQSQSVHHIKSRADGGKHTYFNMIAVCNSHHKEAGDNKITPKELKAYIKKRSPKEVNCIKNNIEKINEKNKKPNTKKTSILTQQDGVQNPPKYGCFIR